MSRSICWKTRSAGSACKGNATGRGGRRRRREGEREGGVGEWGGGRRGREREREGDWEEKEGG